MSIAGRAGAISAAHWKRATIGWLLFAIAAVILGSAVGAKPMSDSDMASGQTAEAERMLAEGGFNRCVLAREGYILYNKNDIFVGEAIERYGEYSEIEAKLLRQVVMPEVRRASKVVFLEDEQDVPLQRPAHVSDQPRRHVRVGVDARPRRQPIRMRSELRRKRSHPND